MTENFHFGSDRDAVTCTAHDVIKIYSFKKHYRVLYIPVPGYSHFVSHGTYTFSDGSKRFFEDNCGPLECLLSLILSPSEEFETEANRRSDIDAANSVVPIRAIFKLTRDTKPFIGSMKMFLGLHVRSKNTTVSFEY